MHVCIHQPDFAPHLSFFERLIDATIFVVYDDVEFHKERWHHRDQIKAPNGRRWLTLSLEKVKFRQTISEVMLARDRATMTKKHIALLSENYKKSPFFHRYIDAIEELYLYSPNDLTGFNLNFIDYFSGLMGIETKTVLSSSLGISGEKSERLAKIVASLGADTYLSGPGATAYLDEAPFAHLGIGVVWQDYQYPSYPQINGPFIPHLSCLDALFNCGPELGNVLRSTRRPPTRRL